MTFSEIRERYAALLARYRVGQTDHHFVPDSESEALLNTLAQIGYMLQTAKTTDEQRECWESAVSEWQRRK